MSLWAQIRNFFLSVNWYCLFTNFENFVSVKNGGETSIFEPQHAEANFWRPVWKNTLYNQVYVADLTLVKVVWNAKSSFRLKWNEWMTLDIQLLGKSVLKSVKSRAGVESVCKQKKLSVSFWDCGESPSVLSPILLQKDFYLLICVTNSFQWGKCILISVKDCVETLFGGEQLLKERTKQMWTSCQEQYLEVQEVIPSLEKLKISMSH